MKKKLNWRTAALAACVLVFLVSGSLLVQDLIRSSRERAANEQLAAMVRAARGGEADPAPSGTGTGGPGYQIRGEFSGNGFEKNDIKHTLGVLSMARSMHPDSAGSQFFIMVDAAPHLDGQYAAFGKITENAEAAVAVSRVPRSMMDDKPKKPQMMKSVRVDTQGETYPEPEKK